jgi:Rod binding domain-containing protein
MTAPISTTLLTGVPQATPTKPEATSTRTVEAAKQFEALLIGQMLRSVREAGADDDEDNASATMYDVADQQFSQLLANNGGLGLSRMIASGLEKEASK